MSGPNVHKDDAKNLWRLLDDGLFHKAKDIDMHSRKIRAICSKWPNQFLSTQSGYKRVVDASNDEIGNAVADLRSRCGHLVRRYMELEKVLVERGQLPLIPREDPG